MGSRGPLGKDPVAQSLRGNTGKRRLPENIEEVADEAACAAPPEIKVPPPPKELSVRAKKVWTDLAPQVAAMGCLNPVDEPLFARYCFVLSEAQRCDQILMKQGTMMMHKNKVKGKRPEVALSAQFWKEAKSLGEKFGITKSARARMGLGSTTQQAAAINDPRLNKFN